MQRALAAALIRKGTSVIHNPGQSEDDKAAIEIIEALGADVEIGKRDLQINSQGINPISRDINCRESGLSIRMFTPIIALCDEQIIIKGEGSLIKRPMDFFTEVLPKLNVKIKSQNGKFPLVIEGPIRPSNIEIDGSLSSQFLTGLIMAFSAANAKNVSIRVNNLKSKPYIDLTLDVMKKFELPIPENKNYQEFIFHNSTNDSRPKIIDYTVESDWSNAAFLLVAGAIAGPITVTGLDLSSTQADKAIVDVLMQANAGIAMEAKGIKVHPTQMNAFEFDATDCPDLFPPLVALAAYCKGTTKIKGVSRLIHKESNRATSLNQEFEKMGVKIVIKDDEMIIEDGSEVKGARVHSHHDHRIAMACAVAALKAKGETIIEAAAAIKKSYPDFFNDLKRLGAAVSLPFNGLTN
jgi:3-phosphoshikimate 1-carboxyvinyltransferase